MRMPLVVVALCLLAPVEAWPKPATTLKIEETTEAPKPSGGESPWYVRADLQSDVVFKGALGGGIGVGRQERFYFYDLSFQYFSTSYGAVRLSQPASSGIPSFRSLAILSR